MLNLSTKPTKKIIDVLTDKLVRRYEQLYGVGNVTSNYLNQNMQVHAIVPVLDDKLNATTTKVTVAVHQVDNLLKFVDDSLVNANQVIAQRLSEARDIVAKFAASRTLKKIFDDKFAERQGELGGASRDFKVSVDVYLNPGSPTSVNIKGDVYEESCGARHYVRLAVALTAVLKSELTGAEFEAAVLDKTVRKMNADADKFVEYELWAAKRRRERWS